MRRHPVMVGVRVESGMRDSELAPQAIRCDGMQMGAIMALRWCWAWCFCADIAALLLMVFCLLVFVALLNGIWGYGWEHGILNGRKGKVFSLINKHEIEIPS